MKIYKIGGMRVKMQWVICAGETDELTEKRMNNARRNSAISFASV